MVRLSLVLLNCLIASFFVPVSAVHSKDLRSKITSHSAKRKLIYNKPISTNPSQSDMTESLVEKQAEKHWTSTH